MDSKAIYTREIIRGLRNTRTACINSSFICDLRKRTPLNGLVPVSRNQRFMQAKDDFFLEQMTLLHVDKGEISIKYVLRLQLKVRLYCVPVTLN